MKKFFAYWKRVAKYAGDLQARLILTIFYFTVAAPFGIMLTLFGDPLQIRRFPEDTGWMKRESQSTSLEDAKSQF